MTKLIGLHPRDVPSDTTWCYPGSTAPNCPSPSEGFQTNPAVNGLLGATKAYFKSNFREQHRRRPDSRGIVHSDYAGRTISARNYWKFGDYPSPGSNTPIDTYSVRFYLSTQGMPPSAVWSGCFPHIITFMNVIGNDYSQTDRFSLMLRDFLFNWSNVNQPFVNQPFFKGETNTDNLTGYASQKLFANTTYRVQIQVQPTAPKVTLKIWNWDATGTPYIQMTCNPPEVSANCFMLGRHPLKCGTSAYIYPWWIGDLELFDTYDLDGTADQHYQTPHYRWYEIVNGQTVPLEEEGTILNGSLDTTDKYNWNDSDREFVFDAVNYTTHNIAYDHPHRGVRSLTLYIRTDPPPPGGWKVITWIHGGFFSAGSRFQIHMGWVRWLLYLGFAVISGDYIYAWQLELFDIPKPDFPDQGSGQFPSFIVDIKLIGLWVQEQVDYPLNADYHVITGHSAGAYLAAAAALSRDFSNFHGYDMTVNSQWGFRTGKSDPAFRGVYVWAAPSDMYWAYDNDKTHPDFGPSNYGRGALKITACLFFGYDADHYLTPAEAVGSSLAEMIAAQDIGKIPPVGICHGKYDAVVWPEHAFMLQNAMLAKGLTTHTFMSDKDHDRPYTQQPERHFERFLELVGMK